MRKQVIVFTAGLALVAMTLGAGSASAARHDRWDRDKDSSTSDLSSSGVGELTRSGGSYFATAVKGDLVQVTFYDSKGENVKPVGPAKGSAVVTFSDGSKEKVKLEKATADGQEVLQGRLTNTTATPVKADVSLSDLVVINNQTAYSTPVMPEENRAVLLGGETQGSEQASNQGSQSETSDQSGNTNQGTSDQYGAQGSNQGTSDQYGTQSSNKANQPSDQYGTQGTASGANEPGNQANAPSGANELPGTGSALPLVLLVGAGTVAAGFGVRALTRS